MSIHRILTDLVAGTDKDTMVKKYSSFAARSSEYSSQNEIRTMNAERECEDCYMAEYMKRYIGDEFDGIISSAAPHGIYVQLKNSVEGLVRADSLGENFAYDGRMSFEAPGGKKKYAVGDEIRIKVTGADVSAGLIDFDLAD